LSPWELKKILPSTVAACAGEVESYLNQFQLFGFELGQTFRPAVVQIFTINAFPVIGGAVKV